MKSSVSLLALVALCLAYTLPAQPLFIQSDLPGTAYHIIPAEEDAFWVFGTGNGTFLFELLPDGEYGWYRQYGPQGANNGASYLNDNLEKRPDQQGYVLSTVTSHPDSLMGYRYPMLYETDLDGNTVDSFILDIPELQGQSGLHVIDDGEYILGGTLSGQHSLREKGFVWRYSMEEDSIIWSHTFQNTNTNYETMVRFIEGRGDTVFVGGYGPSLWDDIHSFVKAMGVDGEVYWSREYQEDDTFLDAHLLPDGIAVVGGRGRFGIAEGQMVIKKLSFAGEELWARTYDFPGRAIANGITGTPDSGMMLCGWASGAGPVLLKIDQDGDLVWSRIIESAAGEPIDGAGQDLYVSADRITCVGWTFDPAEGHKSLIIQTDAEGLLVENKTVELPAAHPLKVFPNPATSNIFVDLPTHIRWEDIVAEVHASDGRLVLQQNGAAARNGIEAGLLTPGFYYLSIRLLESDRLMGTASFVKE